MNLYLHNMKKRHTSRIKEKTERDGDKILALNITLRYQSEKVNSSISSSFSSTPRFFPLCFPCAKVACPLCASHPPKGISHFSFFYVISLSPFSSSSSAWSSSSFSSPSVSSSMSSSSSYFFIHERVRHLHQRPTPPSLTDLFSYLPPIKVDHTILFLFPSHPPLCSPPPTSCKSSLSYSSPYSSYSSFASPPASPFRFL